MMKPSSAYSSQTAMNKLMIASSPLKNNNKMMKPSSAYGSQTAMNKADDSFITVKKQTIK
ncbi:hypothetical protein [Pedobacter immunditicola]|uniref:hypothetical protein n=1 Tax=Pedobacter immunditicola TaxID=3133440 RepID=UPI0030A82194